MAKNKLLTIPIEEDKRERLNQYCGERGKTVSQMITGFIDKLLDGSIDPLASIESSRQPIEVEGYIDVVVERVMSRLEHREFLPVERFEVYANNVEADIKRLRSEMDKVLVNGIDKSIAQPITEHPDSYTLEDTKTYLKDKCDYNRTQERRSDRITQPDIAIHLLTYGYPHPSKKKWNRDEVRSVCKLWGLNT